MTTLTRDPWATLPTNWNTPPKQPPKPPTYAPRWPVNPDKLPQVTCHPRCPRCHHPEDRGTCRRCAIICDHTVQPKRRKLVNICLIRQRVPARLVVSKSTGRALLVIDHCPHCTAPHIHANEPTLGPYRLAPCRQPYLLDTP